jgi:hypothetical protein
MILVGYSRTVAAPPAGPSVVQTWTHTGGGTSVDPISVAFPGAAPGNTLIAAFRVNTTVDDFNRTVSSAPSGWTLVAKLDYADNASYPGFYIYRKTADGSEGAPQSWDLTGSMRFAMLAWEVSGSRTVTATMNGANTDPPAHNPGTSAETLWLAVTATRRGDNAVAAAPANYTGMIQSATGIDATQAAGRIAGAQRLLTASSEDPGAFTYATTDFLDPQAATISVR